MSLKLPASVCSAQDLTSLAMEVKGYSAWFAHAVIKQRVDQKAVIDQPPLMTTAANAIISERSSGKPPTQKDLDALIAELQTLAGSAPTLTITLAAPPTNGIKQSLVGWCRQNIAPDVLVTFQFNSTLLGGMVIRYGSRIFDWSFRRQILDGREKFPEVLRRV